MMKDLNDLISSGFFLLLSVGLFFFITPNFVEVYNNMGLRASFFPNIATIILFIFSLILLLNSGLRVVKAKRVSKDFSNFNLKQIRPFFMALCILIYIILFEKTGFLFSTPIALIGMMLLMGQRHIRLLAVNTAIVLGFLYFVFAYVLNLNLH